MENDNNKNQENINSVPNLVVGSDVSQSTQPLITPDNSALNAKSNFNWGLYAKILSALTLVPLIGYIALMGFLAIMAKNGQSGTEFIALLFIPFLFLLPFLFVIDLVFAVAYLIKSRSSSSGVLFAIITVLICASTSGWLFYQLSGKATQNHYKSLTLTRSEAIAKINNCEVDGISEGYGSIPPYLDVRYYNNDKSKKYIQRSDLEAINNAARNAPFKCGFVSTSRHDNELKYKALSKEELTSLIETCKVAKIIVYYTDNINSESAYYNGLQQTGISAQVDDRGNAYTVEVRKDYREEFVAKTRAGQQKCPDLQIFRKEKDI